MFVYAYVECECAHVSACDDEKCACVSKEKEKTLQANYSGNNKFLHQMHQKLAKNVIGLSNITPFRASSPEPRVKSNRPG